MADLRRSGQAALPTKSSSEHEEALEALQSLTRIHTKWMAQASMDIQRSHVNAFFMPEYIREVQDRLNCSDFKRAYSPLFALLRGATELAWELFNGAESDLISLRKYIFARLLPHHLGNPKGLLGIAKYLHEFIWDNSDEKVPVDWKNSMKDADAALEMLQRALDRVVTKVTLADVLELLTMAAAALSETPHGGIWCNARSVSLDPEFDTLTDFFEKPEHKSHFAKDPNKTAIDKFKQATEAALFKFYDSMPGDSNGSDSENLALSQTRSLRPAHRRGDSGPADVSRTPPPKVDRSPVLGKVYSGVVTGIKEYGVFVNLRGIIGKHDGMIHVTEMPNGPRARDPSEPVSMNQWLRVKIIKINEKNRICLSMKGVNQISPPKFCEDE